jgi:hypothetical protein
LTCEECGGGNDQVLCRGCGFRCDNCTRQVCFTHGTQYGPCESCEMRYCDACQPNVDCDIYECYYCEERFCSDCGYPSHKCSSCHERACDNCSYRYEYNPTFCQHPDCNEYYCQDCHAEKDHAFESLQV